jgi:nucleotide-binding universal stress UspA family protein
VGLLVAVLALWAALHTVGGWSTLTGSDTTGRSVVIWVAEGTWRASVDAGLSLAPAGARYVLLHVTPAEVVEAAHGAYLGLFGRGGRDPGARLDELAAASASELLEAAADRLGRECEKREINGHAERAVVAASAQADLLVMARDGDRSRLGPKSLGKAARFVLDHAACPVLLVWPESAPDLGTIPSPPPRPSPRDRWVRQAQDYACWGHLYDWLRQVKFLGDGMRELGADLNDGAAVAAVRRFNRFYTNVIGLLRGKYLDTPYSLTEARLLFELAQRDTS